MIDKAFAPLKQDRALIEQELQKARHSSLIAARRGEYDKVAQLTLKVVQLSKLISERCFPGPENDLGLQLRPPHS